MSYISNDPLPLLNSIDKLSQRSDTGTSIDNKSVFPTIFLAISIFGLAATIIALVAFLRTYGNKKDESTEGAMYDGEKSTRVPSTIDITCQLR